MKQTKGELWEIADQVYHMGDVEQRRALDPRLMAAGRLVLKNEWEKIKRSCAVEYIGHAGLLE